MTFVINDNCIGSVDMSCVEVCPVDCIYSVGEDPEHTEQGYLLVIDPEECIDCGACEPECPVEAITIDDQVPEKWEAFIAINAMHAGRGAQDGPDEESRMEKADIAEAAAKLHADLVESHAGAP